MTQSKNSFSSIGSILATSAASLYVQFGLQLILGAALALKYSPMVEQAYASAAAFTWMRSVHYWGSAVLIFHSVGHFLAMTWFGWFRPPHQTRYFVSLGMAALALGFQISGNLLPFDRHGVQTTAVEASIAARTPLVGNAVRTMMVGGEDFGQNTLTRWYQAHAFLLSAALLAVLIVGYLAHRKLNDVKENRIAMFAPILVVALLAAGLSHPTSSAASLADFDRFDVLVSWYTWPGHGLLEAFGKLNPNLSWIGTAVVPGILALFFVSLPLVGQKLKLSTVRAALVVVGVAMAGVSLKFGGAFAPLVGKREPAGDIVAEVAAKPKEPQDAKLAALGRELFADEGCKGCHGVDGLVGKSGPSLKNTYKVHSDLDYYMRYIKNPKSVKSGSTMPAYDELTSEQLKSLAEFLRFPRQ